MLQCFGDSLRTDSFTPRTIAPSVAMTCYTRSLPARTRLRPRTTKPCRFIVSVRRRSSPDGWSSPATGRVVRLIAGTGSLTRGYVGAGVGRSSPRTTILCQQGSGRPLDPLHAREICRPDRPSNGCEWPHRLGALLISPGGRGGGLWIE